MTATEPTLFSLPITHGTHRQADPPTSIVAARKDRTGIQREVLNVLVAHGGTGTLDTLSEALPNRLRNSLSRRPTDLEANGEVRKTARTVMGRYGQPLVVWEVV